MPNERAIVGDFINLNGTTGSHTLQRREQIRVRTLVVQLTLDNDSSTTINLRQFGYKNINVVGVTVLTRDSDAGGRWIVTERYLTAADATDGLAVYWQDSNNATPDSIALVSVGSEIRNLPCRVVIDYTERA